MVFVPSTVRQLHRSSAPCVLIAAPSAPPPATQHIVLAVTHGQRTVAIRHLQVIHAPGVLASGPAADGVDEWNFSVDESNSTSVPE